MIMSVVNVRIMWMAVTHLFVPMRMAVSERQQLGLRVVLMMFVVSVAMIML